MEDNILSELRRLRQLFADAAPKEQSVIEKYAWIVCKAINHHSQEIGALECRQLLANLMRLPVPRPSVLYSSILWAATKMSTEFHDFHFIPFLNIWNPELHLRHEDYEQGHSEDGKTFPSLAERMNKAMLHAMISRPEETPSFTWAQTFGYHPVTPMVVVKVSLTEVKGKKMCFAQLADDKGNILMAESHVLHPNATTQEKGKKHYVNVGQLYNVIIRDKQDGSGCRIVEGIVSPSPLREIFPATVGYIEHIDESHGHIHIYDGKSRHFVSSGQKFIKAKVGEFVEFVPVTPLDNKFKTAIILEASSPVLPTSSLLLREILITQINEAKEYCTWELVDKSVPITEQLSQLQLSQGETSPAATSGFMNLDFARKQIPSLAVGIRLKAVIFLRRGKDKTKRPYVAKLF